MAQHALFADKAGNLFHSHSSFLPSDLICLAAPIGVHGQKTWKCWLPGSASSTQIRGERQTANQEGQRIFSPSVMSPTSGGLLLVLVPPLTFPLTLGQLQYARPILQVSYERNNKYFMKLLCRLNEIIK